MRDCVIQKNYLNQLSETVYFIFSPPVIYAFKKEKNAECLGRSGNAGGEKDRRVLALSKPSVSR